MLNCSLLFIRKYCSFAEIFRRNNFPVPSNPVRDSNVNIGITAISVVIINRNQISHPQTESVPRSLGTRGQCARDCDTTARGAN